MRVEFDEKYQKYVSNNLFKVIEEELNSPVLSLDSDAEYQLQRIIAKETGLKT